MNFFKTCFNSFFRTLGRILCYVAIGFVLSLIFSKIDVKADEVRIDSSVLNRQNFVTFNSGNRVLRFDTDLLNDIDKVEKNVLLTFCSDSKKIPTWYSNNVGDTFNIQFYQTNIPCNYSTSDYDGGRILYVYGTSFSCSSSGTSCHPFGSYTFYLPNQSSIQLLNFIYTNSDVSIDYASGSLISSNQDIINQNKTIIEQNQNINNSIKDTNSKLDEAENTRKGIWETIKSIPGQIANSIKGLFIPDNFDFINNFKDTLSNKLGFIAQVPIKLLDFIISLADFSWTEYSSITFPKIEIMGVSFWDDMTIDVGPILGGLKKYRYITDVLCVTLCVNALKKYYDKFTGGGGE